MFTDPVSEKYIRDLTARYPALAACEEEIDKVYAAIKNCYQKGNKLFAAGNGGSAADCEHLVGELMKSFVLPRPLPAEFQAKLLKITGNPEMGGKLQMGLPCISLISHPGLNTAFINDVDAELIYAQQLLVLGNQGDTLIGFSTSGGSKNVCRAFQLARAKGITTILMTGEKYGRCQDYADFVIHAPSKETYKIQEYHLPVYHALCLMLEEAFFGR